MPRKISDETEVFFQTLLGQVPGHLWGHLWTLRDKVSHWVCMEDGPTAFARKAKELSDSSDVYVAVSMAENTGSAKRRIAVDSSAGIYGLWADIDIATDDPDVHKKFGLPPTEEAALELIEACGMKPTMIVHSGHGLQAWWVFAEPWLFRTDADRLAAADLARRWHATLRVRAAERGWTIDSTFDLSRVMRVPGTMNLKSDPVPVTLLLADGPVYNPDDVEEFILDEDQVPAMNPADVVDLSKDSWVYNPNASPDFDLWEALRENAPEVLLLWEFKRTDLKGDFSAYDLGLANLAVDAGWPNQQIVNLIIAFRRKNGRNAEDRKKALRDDYMKRTIAKAYDRHRGSKATEALEGLADEWDQAQTSEDPDLIRDTRRKYSEQIAHLTGVNGVWKKYLEDPPKYALELPTRIHPITFGPRDTIYNQNTFRGILSDALRIQMKRHKQKDWDLVTEAIWKVAQDEYVGEEATDYGEIRTWLEEYLVSKPPMDGPTDLMGRPVVEDGQVKITLKDFRTWLWSIHNRAPDRNNAHLATRLKQYGATPGHVRVRLIDGGTRETPCWILPMDGGDR